MILVMGTIKLADGEGPKAAAMLAAHGEACRAETGCDHYGFSFDAGDPDLVHVAERWETVEALGAHGQADHQKAFGRALREHKPGKMSIKAWNGEFWRTLVEN
jgi:quinol monooxygenase YgiN